MNKLAIVYWSGTGNTETMANCIADGARESGAEVAMLSPGEFSATRFSEFGVVAFGCPAMGAEQLEEDEVEPMFAGVEGSLGGKKIRLLFHGFQIFPKKGLTAMVSHDKLQNRKKVSKS